MHLLKDIGDAISRIKEFKLLIIDRLQFTESGSPFIIHDKDLEIVYEACKSLEVMLAVDITSTFSLLQKEKGAGLKNFDFLIGDLA